MPGLLQSPIEYLKGVGPQKGEVLRKELHLSTFGDLLNYFPFRYVDRSVIHQVRDINHYTQFIQLKGKIDGFRQLGEKSSKRLIARFHDKSGELELVWFKGADWILKTLKPGVEYLVFGKPSLFNGVFNMSHPEVDALDEEGKMTNGTGLQPVYSSSEKAKKRWLDSKGIGKLTKVLIEQLKERDVPEILPLEILQKYKLIQRYDALRNIHFPASEQLIHEATRR